MTGSNYSLGLKLAAGVALLFGALTIFSGGNALFGSEAAQASVGDAVPFVLWFNFLAGFAYVAAGVGLVQRKRWAFWLSVMIAVSTFLVFSALGVRILSGGSFEIRTVGAMILRFVVWSGISMASTRIPAKAQRAHPAY